ncbi:hypothetical protein OTB20_11965 [Streptomyces sp. H27-H1]|uniref:hypothetical protein n=1 Tax=Streptomyces sp. H27-H1 TaxID=2996461 RepID=UPI0022716D4F|nr:hypothetical protein [Streptomyces sp. H27-H1]MCY0926906.1 hypothetical protein [Streptomyces sp. H27-H1]
MITYHGLGYWGLLTIPAALALLRLLPSGSRAHRLLFHATLGALAGIVAIVALSY